MHLRSSEHLSRNVTDHCFLCVSTLLETVAGVDDLHRYDVVATKPLGGALAE